MSGPETSIIIAEDDDEYYALVQEALEPAGFSKSRFRVKDGQELLDFLLKKGDFRDRKDLSAASLVLLDLNLPKKDGREILKEVRRHPLLGRLPVIIFTSSHSVEDIELCYQLGCSSFIVKPIRYPRLIEVLKEIRTYWYETVELPILNTF